MTRAGHQGDSGVPDDLAEVAVEAERPGVRVVTARGELDACSCPAWRETLLTQLAQGDCRLLLVDLAGVAFAGASVLNVLVETREAAQQNEIEMRLVAGPPVIRLLELLGLSGQFAVYDSPSDALTATSGVRGQLGDDR
jgi:anti-sigma B factor antagonist